MPTINLLINLCDRERGHLLNKLANLIESNFEDLARLEVLDNGKPIREARTCDLPDTIDCFRCVSLCSALS